MTKIGLVLTVRDFVLVKALSSSSSKMKQYVGVGGVVNDEADFYGTIMKRTVGHEFTETNSILSHQEKDKCFHYPICYR